MRTNGRIYHQLMLKTKSIQKSELEINLIFPIMKFYIKFLKKKNRNQLVPVDDCTI